MNVPSSISRGKDFASSPSGRSQVTLIIIVLIFCIIDKMDAPILYVDKGKNLAMK